MAKQLPTFPVLRSLRTGTSLYFPASSRFQPRAYTVFHRRLLPALYTDPLDEYWALVHGVVLWDIGTEIPIEVRGRDALALLDWATTRDLTRCSVGECRYVFVTDQDGGIVNDPVVVRLAEDMFWLMPSDSDLLLWLRALAAATQLDVTIRPVDTAPLQIRGPRAREVIAALAGPSLAELPYYHVARAQIGEFEVVVTRTGFSGELGYELMPLNGSRSGPRFWEHVVTVGRPLGLRVAAPSHIRRIEAGIFSYGIDMTLETNPYELTGYEWMVNLRKARFVGREALIQIASEGPSCKVVGFILTGDPPTDLRDGLLLEPLPVRRPGDSDPLGRVTSACWSPQVGQVIGFARVPSSHAQPGSALEVLTAEGWRAARVVPIPFVDPEKRRVKA